MANQAARTFNFDAGWRFKLVNTENRRRSERRVRQYKRPESCALKLDMTSAAPYGPNTGNLAISELHVAGVN